MRKKDFIKNKVMKRKRRAKRVRTRVFGTLKRPRFTIFRSNYHMWCQLINDEKGETILSVHDKELKKKSKSKKTKTQIAHDIGELLAKRAKEKKINSVVFDRNGYKYHGRIKALAEGARGGGLKF